jgi:hypothetical protein
MCNCAFHILIQCIVLLLPNICHWDQMEILLISCNLTFLKLKSCVKESRNLDIAEFML